MSSEDQQSIGDTEVKSNTNVSDSSEISDVVKREAYEGVTKDLHKFKARAKEEAAARAELEVRLKAIEEEKLKEQDNWKKLYEQRNQELEQVKTSVQEEKSKYLRSVKLNALKNELGGKIKDAYLVHANIDSIEFNEDGSLNPDSLTAVANKFREDHSSLIPSQTQNLITNQAASNKAPEPMTLDKLSTAQKLALLNRK